VKKVFVDVNDRAELDRATEKVFALDPSITRISAGKTQHEYLTDEPVFSQGDPALAVFYIQSGAVRLTVRSVEGEQAVISILPQGSFLGECCLAGQAFRSATARALQRSTIVRVEKQALMDLLRSDPEFAGRFLTFTLTRGISIEADLCSAMMSPDSMASTIGKTCSNLSAFLDSFGERGFIDSKSIEMVLHASLMSIVLHDDGGF